MCSRLSTEDDLVDAIRRFADLAPVVGRRSSSGALPAHLWRQATEEFGDDLLVAGSCCGCWLLVPVLVVLYVLRCCAGGSAARCALPILALVKAAMGRSIGWRRHVPPALLLDRHHRADRRHARGRRRSSRSTRRAPLLSSRWMFRARWAPMMSQPNRLHRRSQEAAKKFIADQPKHGRDRHRRLRVGGAARAIADHRARTATPRSTISSCGAARPSARASSRRSAPSSPM